MHIYYKHQQHVKKKRIPLLNLHINCISARLTCRIFSLKDDYNFCFSSFLTIGLFSSSGNCWLGFISLLTADLFACLTVSPEVLAPANFLLKNL